MSTLYMIYYYLLPVLLQRLGALVMDQILGTLGVAQTQSRKTVPAPKSLQSSFRQETTDGCSQPMEECKEIRRHSQHDSLLLTRPRQPLPSFL